MLYVVQEGDTLHCIGGVPYSIGQVARGGHPGLSHAPSVVLTFYGINEPVVPLSDLFCDEANP